MNKKLRDILLRLNIHLDKDEDSGDWVTDNYIRVTAEEKEALQEFVDEASRKMLKKSK